MTCMVVTYIALAGAPGGVLIGPGSAPNSKEANMTDNTLANLFRRQMMGETTTTCDQCGKPYTGPNDTPLFVGLRDTGIGEDMLQAFSWECAAAWFVTRAGGRLVSPKEGDDT
jgi:hypothetical protein